MKKFLLPACMAVVVMVVSAIVQGQWSERWGEAPELKEYAGRLQNIPLKIGDWVGERTENISEEAAKASGTVGDMAIRYTGPKGDVIAVHVICGRLKDVFHHTPERCYPASGFEKGGTAQHVAIETITGDMTDFSSNTYEKIDDNGRQNLRVFWSFSAKGPWEDPEKPRWSFKGQRALYKVYVVHPRAQSFQSTDKPEDSPAVDLIRVLIPALNKAIFPPELAASDNTPA